MATSVAWASRLLPRPWWIRAHVTLLRFHDRSVSFTTGGNFVFFDLNRMRPQPGFRPDLGGAYGFRLFRDALFKPAAPGQLQMVGTRTSIGIGFGYPLVLFAILPLWRVIALWQKRRNGTPGHCRSCGYDLRGTPNRCPECGAPADGVTRLLLARNLQSLRTSRRFSAEEVARRAKLPQALVESVERGERNISIDNIEKLARVLDVSVAELLTKTSDVTDAPQESAAAP